MSATLMQDLRPKTNILRRRKYGHWTPLYLFYRTKLELWNRMHPTAPSLTAPAIKLLEQLLKPSDHGIEWGSGNSTGWLAERTEHLTSLETSKDYFQLVQANLQRRGINNVTYEQHDLVDSDSEDEMIHSSWVQRVSDYSAESLDYALVDSSPRGCLCDSVAPKLKRGGILVLDNANWYIPPPKGFRPTAPGSVLFPLGHSKSRVPSSTRWSRFMEASQRWRRIWTSDGISMTLLMFKQ